LRNRPPIWFPCFLPLFTIYYFDLCLLPPGSRVVPPHFICFFNSVQLSVKGCPPIFFQSPRLLDFFHSSSHPTDRPFITDHPSTLTCLGSNLPDPLLLLRFSIIFLLAFAGWFAMVCCRFFFFFIFFPLWFFFPPCPPCCSSYPCFFCVFWSRSFPTARLWCFIFGLSSNFSPFLDLCPLFLWLPPCRQEGSSDSVPVVGKQHVSFHTLCSPLPLPSARCFPSPSLSFPMHHWFVFLRLFPSYVNPLAVSQLFFHT